MAISDDFEIDSCSHYHYISGIEDVVEALRNLQAEIIKLRAEIALAREAWTAAVKTKKKAAL